MKKLTLSLLALTTLVLSQTTFAQSKVYTVSSGEMIFSWSDAQFKESFMNQYQDAQVIEDPVRFTMFLHFGQYLHVDFNNNIGFFTGLGLRNVGMITNEKLPELISDNTATQNYKLIRRQYMLGIPLALKIGGFQKGFYFFGGGEIEWAFVFKQKYWNSFDRDGDKTKSVTWFGSQTPALIPSVMAGVQFPGGLNVRFKYYLTDFLNNSYGGYLNPSSGTSYNVSDLTRYKSTQLMYVSVCYQIPLKFDGTGE